MKKIYYKNRIKEVNKEFDKQGINAGIYFDGTDYYFNYGMELTKITKDYIIIKD